MAFETSEKCRCGASKTVITENHPEVDPLQEWRNAHLCEKSLQEEEPRFTGTHSNTQLYGDRAYEVGWNPVIEAKFPYGFVHNEVNQHYFSRSDLTSGN